jgi:hypothetical protein
MYPGISPVYSQEPPQDDLRFQQARTLLQRGGRGEQSAGDVMFLCIA